MIVLRPYEPRVLMPVPTAQWRTPSLSLPRDQFGNEVVRTYFRLTAKAHDGHVVWAGWFESRDDADAFLWAMATGSLRYERELWRLPTPEWHPGISEELSYHFATVTFLTATSSSTYTKPGDWNDSNNTVECVGAGGSGGIANRATAVVALATGGGGGGYGKYTNLSLSGNATYQCGTHGSSVTRSTAGATNGNAGTDTWFGVSATDYASASVGGVGGGAGQTLNTGTSGTVSGGAGGGGKGTSSFTGGNGGAITNASSTPRVGTGGGGAAGKNANGNNGAEALNVTGSTARAGGQGDGTFGGAGGSNAGGAGGNGTEWQASPAYGSGGGGGGREASTTSVAGAGGTYGAGGGGAGGGSSSGPAATTVTSGDGTQGLIVVTYEPATPSSFSLANNNIPMIGM